MYESVFPRFLLCRVSVVGMTDMSLPPRRCRVSPSMAPAVSRSQSNLASNYSVDVMLVRPFRT